MVQSDGEILKLGMRVAGIDPGNPDDATDETRFRRMYDREIAIWREVNNGAPVPAEEKQRIVDRLALDVDLPGIRNDEGLFY